MFMKHHLNIPYMVENEHLEGQGWSPDHLAWLPLSLILAWDLEVEGPKLYDGFFGNIYFIQIKFKNEKKMLEIQLKQWLLWAQISEFYILLRLAITPYCP